MNKFESFKDEVLEKFKAGKIVFATFEGFMEADIKNFIKQPADGILYDLNRNEATVLTFIEDRKWVNDFAVAKTIRALKERIEELEQRKP